MTGGYFMHCHSNKCTRIYVAREKRHALSKELILTISEHLGGGLVGDIPLTNTVKAVNMIFAMITKTLLLSIFGTSSHQCHNLAITEEMVEIHSVRSILKISTSRYFLV